MAKRSAYLAIYEDWEFLRPSLESVLPFIDELVVVDGAYKWMAGFLRSIGKDPLRSNRRVYNALANLSVPVRVITDIWEDEFEKRAAGYNACSHRYVFRVDADEIVFPNHSAIQRFIDSGGAAAQMEIPSICHTPAWVEARAADEPLPRVGFLFDKEQVHAMDHLRYLWIVSKDRPDQVAASLPALYPEAVALTAHLTGWRSPEGARNRAAFYNLAYIRNYGCPWLPTLEGREIPDLAEFFQQVDPNAYDASLLTSAQSCADFDFANKIIAPAPFNEQQRVAIRPHHDFFLNSHVERNLELYAQQWFLQGQLVRVDVTTPEALACIVRDGIVSVEFSHQPTSAMAEFNELFSVAPYSQRVPLEITLTDRTLHIRIPIELRNADLIRRMLRFTIWTKDFDRLQQYKITGRQPMI